MIDEIGEKISDSVHKLPDRRLSLLDVDDAVDDDGDDDGIGLSLGSVSAFFCQTSMIPSIGFDIPNSMMIMMMLIVMMITIAMIITTTMMMIIVIIIIIMMMIT